MVLLDIGARMVDEVHEMHARRAGGHAAQAAQAAIDVPDRLFVGDPAILQHVLDEVDAPARAVALVAQEHVGGAHGGAEAAMHAAAQDGVRFLNARIGELLRREGGLHRLPLHVRVHAAWIEYARGIEGCFEVARQALDLEEQNADAHYLYAANLGSAAQLKGTMASALTVQDLKAHVRRALELNGNHAPALHMMGMMMEELPWLLGGDAEAALTYLKRAVLADTAYIHARLDLAKIYLKRQASDEARRELRVIVEGPQPAALSAGGRRYREEALILLNTLRSR